MIDDFRHFLSFYPSNWSDWWPQLVPSIVMTIELTIGAFGLAVVIGLALAFGKMSRNRLIKGLATSYVELARGIPALAILITMSAYVRVMTVELMAIIVGLLSWPLPARVIRAQTLSLRRARFR